MNTLGHRSSNDFAAVELYDGILYFVINVGDGVHHIRASEEIVNDGQPHAVSIQTCYWLKVRLHFAIRHVTIVLMFVLT